MWTIVKMLTFLVVLSVGLIMGPSGQSTTNFSVISISSAQADEGNCWKKAADECGVAAPGHKYKGGKKIPLQYCVYVEHPYWDQLDEPWFSFAFVSKWSKVEPEIRRVSRSKDHMAREEVEVYQRRVKHCYEPGRVIILAVSCIQPGKYTFMVSQPLRPEDNGTVVRLYDRPEFRKYAFPNPVKY